MPIAEATGFDRLIGSSLQPDLVRTVIKEAVVSVKALRLETSQVTVRLLREYPSSDENWDVIIRIWGLTAKDERTLEVQNELAARVKDAVRDLCKINWYAWLQPQVEVYVFEFDPDSGGFASTADDRQDDELPVIEVEPPVGASPLVNQQLKGMMGDAPFCDKCGHITVRNGSKYKCLNCGNEMDPEPKPGA